MLYSSICHLMAPFVTTWPSQTTLRHTACCCRSLCSSLTQDREVQWTADRFVLDCLWCHVYSINVIEQFSVHVVRSLVSLQKWYLRRRDMGWGGGVLKVQPDLAPMLFFYHISTKLVTIPKIRLLGAARIDMRAKSLFIAPHSLLRHSLYDIPISFRHDIPFSSENPGHRGERSSPIPRSTFWVAFTPMLRGLGLFHIVSCITS